MRQTGRSSRIVDYIVDQLFSVGRCISTDHTAYEYAFVSNASLSYLVDKVKERIRLHSHGSQKIEHNFIKVDGIKMIDFKLIQVEKDK